MVTGLLGLALTYYYDDAGNHKLQTILRVALQLVGLGLVAISTTLPEASAGLCCLLILLRLTPALLPFWYVLLSLCLIPFSSPLLPPPELETPSACLCHLQIIIWSCSLAYFDGSPTLLVCAAAPLPHSLPTPPPPSELETPSAGLCHLQSAIWSCSLALLDGSPSLLVCAAAPLPHSLPKPTPAPTRG